MSLLPYANDSKTTARLITAAVVCVYCFQPISGGTDCCRCSFFMSVSRTLELLSLSGVEEELSGLAGGFSTRSRSSVGALGES